MTNSIPFDILINVNKREQKTKERIKKLEKFIVVDTETTNSIDDPIVYDVGFAVVDAEGNVYEQHSYVVADVFLDKDLMSYAYFADKIPQYWEDIKSGKRKLRRFKTIRMIFKDVCKQYGIKKIFAHNAKFDNRSLNLTQRYLTSSKFRWFFPYNIEICDTLKMSKNTLKNVEAYDQFCWDNDFITKRGCKRYTAEIIYRFITGKLDFEESHTGLEDVLIEKEILKYCLKHNPEFSGKLW